MGSNKRHKTEKTKENKKKRQHRSRSRSHSLERVKNDKHRHHKKHKRKERKEYDSDVEIVSAPPPPKISRGAHLPTPPPPPDISRIRRENVSPPEGNCSQMSLSVQETNKLRAKLGLKPLEAEPIVSKDDVNKIKDDLGEFYHKPAANANDILKTQKIKERLDTRKEKRRIETNLSKIGPLGGDKEKEEDSDDDARAWIEKNRRLQNEKKKAEERAKMLDMLDEEFGIGNLVKEEEEIERGAAYTTSDLRGLRVEHDIENFQEGQTLILTLKDNDVLNDDNDVLVNVNMKDDERYKKNVTRKAKKPEYNAYDEDNLDEYGISKDGGGVLDKYDEEIDGEKKKSFRLGVDDDADEARDRRAQTVKQRLANKKLESLISLEPKLASEYYNDEEMAKFKKPKKKLRKIRRKKIMLKAEDLAVDPNTDYLRDLGSRRNRKSAEAATKEARDEKMHLDVDDYDSPLEDLTSVKIEEDDKELAFQLAIKKAQRIKRGPVSSIERVAATIKHESESAQNSNDQFGNIILNSTAEFCRTLGDIPTYGLAGNREENDQELMDFETDGAEEEAVLDDEESGDGRGAWNTVQHLEKSAIEPVTMEAAILDAEPSLGQGVGGALRLALSKGYLQKEDTNRPSASRFAHLQAQNYSIEDKAYGDDDKFGRRDRFNGPTSEFKEKDGFKPNVKLEYIDDDGHVLCAKEAFRYLSHKFHGKGPGKNKVEKRMKKAEQEVLMKRMSSTDTPLGTLNLLQAKQKETQSPYIVLSGSKHMQATTISKSKH